MQREVGTVIPSLYVVYTAFASCWLLEATGEAICDQDLTNANHEVAVWLCVT
jgi:hypothetical protein